MKQKAIICDLDGTLCNNKQREHLVQQTPKDYKNFYDGIPNDELNNWCHSILTSFCHNTHIILLSGRPSNYRNLTKEWLDKHNILYDVLHMRPENDSRQDFEVKEEIYHKIIKPDYEVLFTIDDRKQVVDMWRRNGLICLQCVEGNY